MKSQTEKSIRRGRKCMKKAAGVVTIGDSASLPAVCGRVRFYRQKLGIEQKELAARLGITANAVSNWEQGRSRPDIDLLPALCESLGVSLNDLMGMRDTRNLTEAERQHLEMFRELKPGNRKLVDGLMRSMILIQKAESLRPLREVRFFDKPLAAGFGDPSEFEGLGEPMYLYDSDEYRRGDYVFRINGDSMEPDYRDGDLVLVERGASGLSIGMGEVGAFIVGNETYIKVREEDGLHSLNPKYDVLKFGEESVYLIGKVLTVLDPEKIAAASDVELFRMLHE